MIRENDSYHEKVSDNRNRKNESSRNLVRAKYMKRYSFIAETPPGKIFPSPNKNVNTRRKCPRKTFSYQNKYC